MRRNRLIWFSLLILSIISISYYGGTISYSFFYSMLIIPILSLLYLLYVYCFFRIYQFKDAGHYAAGDVIPYKFRLMNEYPLTFVGIRVTFFSSFSTINGLSDKTEYELLPHTGITRETTIVCHYRGEYNIGIKEVEIQDYLRLFKIRFVNNECRKVTIYPRIIELDSLENIEIQSLEAKSGNSKPDVTTREYVAGDDVRFINWGQSARTGSLMTRNRISEESKGIAVIFDSCKYSENPHEYLPSENKILELTLAISAFLYKKGISVREYYLAKKLNVIPVENDIQFEAFYNDLAILCFDPENSQNKLFENLMLDGEIFDSEAVHIILPFLSQDAAQMIGRLVERGIRTAVYIVSDKKDEESLCIENELADIRYVPVETKIEEECLT